MAYLLIDPSEVHPYTFDWSDVLGAATISTSTWSVRPTGPTVAAGTNTTTTATTTISACTAGKTYQLINTITTSAGATEQKSIALRCFNT